MQHRILNGRRILVVEDEYFFAQDLDRELSDAQAVVIGPAPSVRLGLEALAAEDALDGAVLDVNLGGEMVYPLADALAVRGVPFLFTTGYDADVLPERYAGIVRCEKPANAAVIVEHVRRVVGA